MNFESAFLGPQSIQVCHLRSKTSLTTLTAYVDRHVDPTWTVYLQITPFPTLFPQGRGAGRGDPSLSFDHGLRRARGRRPHRSPREEEGQGRRSSTRDEAAAGAGRGARLRQFLPASSHARMPLDGRPAILIRARELRARRRAAAMRLRPPPSRPPPPTHTARTAPPRA